MLRSRTDAQPQPSRELSTHLFIAFTRSILSFFPSAPHLLIPFRGRGPDLVPLRPVRKGPLGPDRGARSGTPLATSDTSKKGRAARFSRRTSGLMMFDTPRETVTPIRGGNGVVFWGLFCGDGDPLAPRSAGGAGRGDGALRNAPPPLVRRRRARVSAHARGAPPARGVFRVGASAGRAGRRRKKACRRAPG